VGGRGWEKLREGERGGRGERFGELGLGVKDCINLFVLIYDESIIKCSQIYFLICNMLICHLLNGLHKR
jgi:hypothetical protein